MSSSIIERTVEAWAAYMAFIKQNEDAIKNVTAQAPGLRVEMEFKFPDVLKLAEETAVNIRYGLIKQAISEFSPDVSTPIVIDESKVAEKFPIHFCKIHARELSNGYKQTDPFDFDPVAIWEYLSNTYGGDAAEENAFSEVAYKIIRHFSLDYKAGVIRQIRGQTVFHFDTYIDDTEKKYSGVNRLCYSSAPALNELCGALRSFFYREGDNLSGTDIDNLARRFYHGTRHEKIIQSREIIPIGEHAQVVTFNTKFEFRFNADMADKLQIFLGTYAPGAIKVQQAMAA